MTERGSQATEQEAASDERRGRDEIDVRRAGSLSTGLSMDGQEMESGRTVVLKRRANGFGLGWR